MKKATPQDEDIVYAKIHPSIGIARVGNSKKEEGFYIGPQVSYPHPQPPGFYRDATGALKREVAEFRIYGYNAQGQVVRELLMDDTTDVEWTVELANHKAAWYNFEMALDIPESVTAAPSTKRNANFKTDRSCLSIKPGPRSIAQAGAQGPAYHFTGGKFLDIEVPLGELRTDGEGRLRVFGGLGKSGSIDGKPPTTFANNDGWYDDTSDGPVTAKVKLQGRELAVSPAWVVVAPPNYGPQQKSVRTMFALMTDVAIAAGQLPAPTCPSFREDIYPILKALCDLQWMNAGFAAGFGYGMPQHFLAPEYLHKLAMAGDTYAELRRTITNAFRNPARDISMQPWPWIYGDAMDVPMPLVTNAMNYLTTTQRAQLDYWAKGQFVADYDSDYVPPGSLAEVPVAEQPANLDKAALEFCLADAFHPGCEMTWPVRHATMYLEPYRWRHRPKDDQEPDYGKTLTSAEALSYNGPLYAQFPGSITRWMAIPWQTDTASCRSGYDAQYDPYLPTFWPARVPNQVLREEDYQQVMNVSLSRDQRLAAFNKRSDWNRTLGPHDQQLANMIDRFPEMGIVEVRPGIANDPDFPPLMQVEDRGGKEQDATEQALTRKTQRALITERKP